MYWTSLAGWLCGRVTCAVAQGSILGLVLYCRQLEILANLILELVFTSGARWDTVQDTVRDTGSGHGRGHRRGHGAGHRIGPREGPREGPRCRTEAQVASPLLRLLHRHRPASTVLRQCSHVHGVHGEMKTAGFAQCLACSGKRSPDRDGSSTNYHGCNSGGCIDEGRSLLFICV